MPPGSPDLSVQTTTPCATAGEPARLTTATGAETTLRNHSWQIDGESTDASGDTFTYAFDEAGDHEIVVSAQDQDGRVGTATRTLTVHKPGESPDGFAVAPGDPIVGESVQFQSCDGGRENATYEWTLGDDGAATGSQVFHAFEEAGEHAVTLAVTENGTTEETERTVEVSESGVRIESIESSVDGYPLAGLDTPIELTANVATTNDSVEEVRFSYLDTTRTDDDGSDGWSLTVNTDELIEPTSVTATAIGESGATAEKHHIVFVVPPPPGVHQVVQQCQESYVRCSGFSDGFVRLQMATPPVDLWVFRMNGAVGGQWNPPTGTLQGVGGGVVGIDVPLDQASLAADLKFGYQGQTRYDQSEGSFTDSSSKLKGGGGVRGHADVPIPGAWFGAAGLEARLAGKIFLTGEFDIADGLVPTSRDDFDLGARRFDKAQAEIQGMPLWVDATVCEGGAGGEVSFSAEKPSQLVALDGELAFAAVAEVQCLFRKVTKKATLLTMDFSDSDRAAQSASTLSTSTGTRYRVANESSSGWELKERVGRGPGGITESDAGVGAQTLSHDPTDGDVSPVVTSPLGGSELGRLTADDVADSSPALTGSDDGYTLVWARQAKEIEAGKDVYTATYRDGGWSDPEPLTDDRRGQIDPDVAGSGDDRLAVWATIDREFSRDELANGTSPTEVASHLETTIAHDDGDGWETTQLTDDDVMDVDHRVAHDDGAYLLAWQRDADANVTSTGANEYVYTVYENGTTTERQSFDADGVAIGAGEDGFRLARVANGTVAVDRISQDGSRTTAATHDVEAAATEGPPVSDLAVGHDEIAWVPSGEPEPSIRVLQDGAVETLAVEENVTELQEVELHTAATQDYSLLTYRGREPGTAGTELFYRVRQNGTWITDHGFASGAAENLTLWQSDTATMADGFQSVYLGQPPIAYEEDAPRPTADVFHTEHSFRPDYELTATVFGPVRPNETAEVNYTLANVGERTPAEPVSVEAANATGVQTTNTHDPLAPGESIDVTVEVTADASGQLSLVADPDGAVEELDEDNNRATVTTGTPALAVELYGKQRVADTVTVNASLTNAGNATAHDRTLSLTNGNQTLDTAAVDRIDPNESVSLSVETTDAAVDRSQLAVLAVTTPDGTEAADRRQLRVFDPDLAVDHRSVRYVRQNGSIQAELPVANRGTASADATVEVVRGNETLGTSNATIDAATNGTTAFETVPLRLPADAEGDAVSIRVEAAVTDSAPADNGFDTAIAPILEPIRPPEIEAVSVLPDDSPFSDDDTVSVEATVTDPDGDLANVTVDATALGAGTVSLAATDEDDRYAGTITVNESGALPGDHRLSITAEDDAGATTERSTEPLTVEVLQCIPFDGGEVCDTDGDGSYRDVNGDGSVSNGDVVDFFGNQHVPPWDERTDLFDFDGNDDVGQSDVIELFRYING